MHMSAHSGSHRFTRPLSRFAVTVVVIGAITGNPQVSDGATISLIPTYSSGPFIDAITANGLKDNANYLWNDEYDSSEAGSPYGTASQNIYKVDNLRASFQTRQVPEPAGLSLFGFVLLAAARHFRRRRRQQR